MLIAFHRNQNFRTRKRLFDRWCAVWLRLVPLWIALRRRVNVVLCSITVSNAQLLVNLNTQHVRTIVTTVLIKLNRSGRRIPFEVSHFLPSVVVPSLI